MANRERKAVNVTMPLRILGLILVKEIFDFVYLACRGIFKDNEYKWILVGCGVLLTLMAYLIFRVTGFKYPIACATLTSCPWLVIYDIKRN